MVYFFGKGLLFLTILQKCEKNKFTFDEKNQ